MRRFLYYGGNQQKSAKVASIEIFNRLKEEAKARDEVSLLLAKISPNEVKKGYVVTTDSNPPKLTPQFVQVIYSEREIPDDSDEAKQILAEREKHKNETPTQQLKRFSEETRECP